MLAAVRRARQGAGNEKGKEVIKHISFIKRHANVSREEFRKYWEEVHAPLVREALPTLKKYVGNFTIEEDKENNWGLETRGNVLDCDLVVELHFDSIADMHKSMQGPGWLNDKRRASSSTVIDYKVMQMVITEVVDIPLK